MRLLREIEFDSLMSLNQWMALQADVSYSDVLQVHKVERRTYAPYLGGTKSVSIEDGYLLFYWEKK